ncbi:hypothetical protein, partial [Citrobacter freundii]|uniref:hypothetical protein n=1 Tax=Citrobacter freundii TaxID=546 RepID=UPI00195314AC
LARSDRPTLIVHSRDDREIPFADAERLAGAGSATEFAPMERLGHRRILYAPEVIGRVVAFMQKPASTGL